MISPGLIKTGGPGEDWSDQSCQDFPQLYILHFSVFVEERNALQEHVCPRLRELCAKHGCRQQAADLRWGVGVEAR